MPPSLLFRLGLNACCCLPFCLDRTRWRACCAYLPYAAAATTRGCCCAAAALFAATLPRNTLFLLHGHGKDFLRAAARFGGLPGLICLSCVSFWRRRAGVAAAGCSFFLERKEKFNYLTLYMHRDRTGYTRHPTRTRRDGNNRLLDLCPPPLLIRATTLRVAAAYGVAAAACAFPAHIPAYHPSPH